MPEGFSIQASDLFLDLPLCYTILNTMIRLLYQSAGHVEILLPMISVKRNRYAAITDTQEELSCNIYCETV
jgi:hypothetical protein